MTITGLPRRRGRRYENGRGRREDEERRGRKKETHLDSQDLSIQLPSFIGSNTSSNNRSTNSTSPTKGSLGRKEDVWDVLVFTEEG